MQESRYETHSYSNSPKEMPPYKECSHTGCFRSGYHHWSLFESHSHTLYWKKPWHKTRLVTLQVPKNGHHIHQVKDSLLCHWMVHIYLSIDCDFMKTNLNNYNGIIKPRKHMQNMWSIPELVTQDIDVMHIILMTTLCGYT